MTYETIVNIEKRMLQEYVQMRERRAAGVFDTELLSLARDAVFAADAPRRLWLREYVQMCERQAVGVYNLAPTRREQEMAAGYFDNNVVGTIFTDNTAEQ